MMPHPVTVSEEKDTDRMPETVMLTTGEAEDAAVQSKNDNITDRMMTLRSLSCKTGIKGSNSKAPSLRPARLIRSSAKDVILEVVDFLEKENEQLRTFNMKILKEMDQIKDDNEHLRNDLKTSLSEKHNLASKIDNYEKEQRKLKANIQDHNKKYLRENEEREQIHSQLLAENAKQIKQIENMRMEIAHKEGELKRRVHEMETLRQKVETTIRNSMMEKKMELLYEVEMLKNEKKELNGQKEELHKLNNRLQDEVKGLESKINGQEAELRNENRRHSLLTKEFNSLLEENNRLKLQMRRRTIDKKLSGNAEGESKEPTMETTVRIDTHGRKGPIVTNRKTNFPATSIRRSHTVVNRSDLFVARSQSLTEALPVIRNYRDNTEWSS